MIDMRDKITEFVESIDDLNIFCEDGTASSSIINRTDGTIEGHVSYIGQFLGEDLSMKFKYFIEDNTYKATFHSWDDHYKIDLTDQYIDTERMQDVIRTLKDIADRCFT